MDWKMLLGDLDQHMGLIQRGGDSLRLGLWVGIVGYRASALPAAGWPAGGLDLPKYN